MERRRHVLFLLLCTVVYFMAPGLAAAAPKIDSSFGTNGILIRDFGIGDDEIYGLTVQEDGKIIAVGFVSNGAVKNLAVARYLADGTPDVDFNNDGLFTRSLGIGNTIGRSVQLLPDGRMIIAGSVDDGEINLVLLCLTAEGYVDTTFGEDGTVRLATTDREVLAADVEIDAAGNILVAGTIAEVNGKTSAMFARLTIDGQPVEGFGVDGTAVIEQESSLRVMDVIPLPDGRILAAGTITREEIEQAGMIRLSPDGSLDLTFGNEGVAAVMPENWVSSVNALGMYDTETFYLAGYISLDDGKKAFVAKVDSNGKRAESFAAEGIYLSEIAGEHEAHAMSLAENGLILIAGVTRTAQGEDVFMLTLDEKQLFLENGGTLSASAELTKIAVAGTEVTSTPQEPVVEVSLDSAYTVTDVASMDDVGNAITITPDGKIIAAGATYNGSNSDFVLLRYVVEENLVSQVPAVQAAGVISSGYSLLTAQVTDITRVSAVSGGTITDTQTLSCETSCTAQCESEEEAGETTETTESEEATETTCYDSCLTACQEKPTVVQRGVCFSVSKLPVYAAESEEEEETEVADSTAVHIFPQGNSFTYDIVRSGQTEDGEGIGQYSSEILEITPNTKYYLRAYAVLSDDTVIYGNEVSFETNDACFIATAAYGSILDRHVNILRELRDDVLMDYAIGQKLIAVYYRVSPPIADWVAASDVLRGGVRVLLLPVVLLAQFVLKTTLLVKLLLLSLMVAGGVLYMRKVHRKSEVLT